MEMGNLPEKEFRMTVKINQDLGKRTKAKVEKMQEMFTKDLRTQEQINRLTIHCCYC